MKRKDRRLKAGLVLGAAVALLWGVNGVIAYAGSWQQNGYGWWWQEEDGSYPVSAWKWIDGDGDGISQCYYFNPEGYCLMNGFTPDGFQVNEKGEWIVGGIPQVSGAGLPAENKDGNIPAELSYEEAKARLLAYYNHLRADDGNYTIVDQESVITDSEYRFMVRYQMSDAEVQERLSRGGFPMANILVGMDVVNKSTKIAKLENGTLVDLMLQQ